MDEARATLPGSFAKYPELNKQLARKWRCHGMFERTIALLVGIVLATVFVTPVQSLYSRSKSMRKYQSLDVSSCRSLGYGEWTRE